MSQLLLKNEVFHVVGAAIEVHKTLGTGFLEGVYQEALELELTAQDIPFESQKPINIDYKGYKLEQHYFADLICYDQIIVELKALDSLNSKAEAQVLNYLKATGLKVGLLINFGRSGKLDWKRFVY